MKDQDWNGTENWIFIIEMAKKIRAAETEFNQDLYWKLLPMFLHQKTSRNAFNSLWPSDAIWRHKSGSTLAQEMACCLTAPSHYLNHCWLISSVGPYDMHLIISHEILKNSFKNMNKKVTFLEILPHLPITGINPEAVWWRDDHYDHPLCPGLQPGPPSQTPGGLGQRYWSVSEVMWPPKLVFRRWGGLQGPPA